MPISQSAPVLPEPSEKIAPASVHPALTVKRPHHVVVVGGGFGGLLATRCLRKGDLEVTLVDRTNHHLFQPLLYQVATGILSEGQIAPPLRGVLRKQKHVQVELAEVTGFDLEHRTWLTFAVVGGGPTGCEVPGQIAELARRTLRQDFRAIDPTSAAVLLVEADKQILRGFGDRLSLKATSGLERMGVDVRTETRVTSIDGDGFEVESPGGRERVATRTVVWAAGVQASPLARILAEASGAECDRAGRVAVRPDCTLPGHPEVFVIGDAMTLDGLPGVGGVASQQGIYVARTIRGRLESKPQGKPFAYRDLGSMATLGRGHAIVSVHGLRYGGFFVFLSWLFVHLALLTGYRNRFGALIAWSWAFIGNSHNQRAFTVKSIGGSHIYRGFAPTRELTTPS